jgi:hypothetical protein
MRKNAAVVSHAPAPRFGVGQGEIPTWSIGRRRRLTGIRATTVAGVARCGVRRAVEHRRNEQQRRGAEDHEHARNDARLLRKNVKCGAPDQYRQNSGSTEDREHNAKAETRSLLLTGDLSSDIHRSDQHYRERECPDNHGHDSGTLAPTPGEPLNTSGPAAVRGSEDSTRPAPEPTPHSSTGGGRPPRVARKDASSPVRRLNDCSADTSPRGPTSPCTASSTSTASPTSSNDRPRKRLGFHKPT